MIAPEQMTSSVINKAFGFNEYSVVGSLPEDEDIDTIQIIMEAQDQTGTLQNFISLKNCTKFDYPVPPQLKNEECLSVVAPQTIWEQSQTEKFMERLWAYKRINYLLDDWHCFKEINDDEQLKNGSKSNKKKNECEEEATQLAIKYNFVTDLTSLIIEENNEYTNNDLVKIGKPGFQTSSEASHSSFGYTLSNPIGGKSIF